jgi:(1->4)-alpha-D-glucan 1-alpha-D-glucosylmutase
VLLDSLQRLEADTERPLGERLRDVFASPYEGRAKLWIVYRLLRFRQRHRELFDAGTYVPLTANGSRSRQVLAFARLHGSHGFVAVAGRLFGSVGLRVGEVPLGAVTWGDTMLDARVVPQGTLVTDVMSGTAFQSEQDPWPLARLFAHFPGAVLTW